LGRFISEDPIQDGSNWYMFAGNDPVNFADPTGLSQAGYPLLAGGFSGNKVAPKPKVPLGSFSTPVSTFQGFVGAGLGSQILSGGLGPVNAGQRLPSNLSLGGGLSSQTPTISAFHSSLVASSNLNSLLSYQSPSVTALQPPQGSILHRATGEQRIRNLGATINVDARELDALTRTVYAPEGPRVTNIDAVGGGRATQGSRAGGGPNLNWLLDAVLPRANQSYRVQFEDGSSKFIFNGEPETGRALALAATFLPTPKPVGAPQVPGLRGPVAQTAPGKNFIPVTHVEAAAAEFDLMQAAQKQGHVILKANQTVTQNGADLITYNPKTGQVTLWDSKTTIGRLNTSGQRVPKTVAPSTTLTNRSTLNKALQEAQDAIGQSRLSPLDRAQALQSIENDTFRKVTAGAGNSKNSVIQYGR
jgi:hypothetical protein